MSRVEQKSIMFEHLEIRGKHFKSQANTAQSKLGDTSQYWGPIKNNMDQKEYDIYMKTKQEEDYCVRAVQIKQQSVQQAINICQYGMNWSTFDKLESYAGSQKDLEGKSCHYYSKGLIKGYCYNCWQIVLEARQALKEQ